MTGFFDYDAADAQTTAPPSGDTDIVLSGLSEQDWRQIREHAQVRRYRSGDTILDEGDTGRDLFIVLSGEVVATVRTNRVGPRRMQPMGPGSVFGEIGFFVGGRRTAGIAATSETELLRLSFESYRDLAAQDPHLAQRIVFDLGRVLAARLVRAERAEDLR